jgi:hypothetical protein
LRIIAALLPVSLPLPRAIMPEITGQQGDVIFIERRREPRIIVSMPAAMLSPTGATARATGANSTAASSTSRCAR